MTINLYKNNSDKNYVDKQLTLVDTLTGTLRTPCDIVNPVISIEYGTVPDFNYIFITEFNRYYYVTSITSERNGFWTINLHVDVLMSFKGTFRLLSCVIKRTSDATYIDTLLNDSEAVKLASKTLTEYAIDTTDADFEFFEDYDLWTDTNANIYTLTLTKPEGIPQP